MPRLARKSPANTKNRRRPSARRPAPRRSRRWLWIALVLAVAVGAYPPARGIAIEAFGIARAALATVRAAEARERRADEYARRYGIDREMAAAVLAAAEEERVNADLAFRLVRVESGFHEGAESPVGALGLTQLMPRTAAELRPGITRAEILDRDTNLRLGFRYFRRLLRRYDGDVAEALHAYNRGLGTVDRIRARGGDPANGYARAVLGRRGLSPVGPPKMDTVAAPLPIIDGLPAARLPEGR